MTGLFDDPDFYVNDAVISPDEAEEAIDGLLRSAYLAWHRLRPVLPRMMGGIDRQHDEDTGRCNTFLWWSVDQGRGIKLFADYARCFYTDERGDSFNNIEYGPRIEYDEPNFIELVIHQLRHAAEAALQTGAITCPECGTAIAVTTT